MTPARRSLAVVGVALVAASLLLAAVNHVLVNAADRVLVDYGTPTPRTTSPRSVP